MHKPNVKKANKTAHLPTVVGYACKMQSQFIMVDTHSFSGPLQMKIRWLVVLCAWKSMLNNLLYLTLHFVSKLFGEQKTYQIIGTQGTKTSAQR